MTEQESKARQSCVFVIVIFVVIVDHEWRSSSRLCLRFSANCSASDKELLTPTIRPKLLLPGVVVGR